VIPAISSQQAWERERLEVAGRIFVKVAMRTAKNRESGY
jgi:hypothetical protein